MSTFRFGILGAGKIAVKFCQAANLIPDCEICAVASKSKERAENLVRTGGLTWKSEAPRAYGSYEEMLDTEKPDCAYIAVTPNDHCRLALLCIERGIPVLCEKAMFQDSREAEEAYAAAAAKGVFVMEAMWSRFLPAVKKVREWVEEGRIGIPEISQISIGFIAPEGNENRYLNPLLGGGAAKDITVYAYEITTWILNQEIKKMDVSATKGESGVDINNHISIQFTHTLADLTTSFAANLESRMVLYGKKGKILLPTPHHSFECFLYNEKGELTEHFTDRDTVNGFTYEMEEAIRCIRAGKTESPVIPWKDTLECARLFDRIQELL